MTTTTEALVLGGSIAGLVAARVMADHVDKVTVLERQPEPGPGQSLAAQGRMLHVMLESGAEAIEQLFPGFRDGLRARGAVDLRPADGCFWNEGYRVGFDTDITVQSASRGLIESSVRERLRAIRNVSIRYGTPVTGLLTADGVVTGVRTPTGDLPADLVIDSSGRSSKAARWLTEAGLTSPRLEEIGVDVWYAQTILQHDDGPSTGPGFVLAQPLRVRRPRGGAAITIEDGQRLLGLMGYFGDRAPRDREGYLGFADTLPSPDIADLLRRAGDLGPVVSYNFKSSRRWHYEATPPPPGFLPLGDSMCSFNPLYGQGMSVAALEGAALGDLLEHHGLAPDMPGRAARAFSAIIDNPWQIAAGADLAYPGTTGTRTPATRLSNAYARLVLRATTVDPVVAEAMFEVQNLLAGPNKLMRPDILARTLRAQRRWRRTQSNADASHARQSTARHEDDMWKPAQPG